MAEFDSVDKWFDKGFRVRRQPAAKQAKSARRDQRRGGGGGDGGGQPARRGELNFSAGAKATNVKAVAKRAPEVMVKITGNSKGLKSVKNHLEYISRNGDVELVNEAGESIKGISEVKALREQLKAAQIPEESNKREFLHVIFSMPAGTPDKAVREAVANFCQEEFSNRRYVMAQHDDTDHSHVHVCVSTRDIDRADEARLSPRKDDLFRWRQGFADKLREQGVDAAASERRHRFNYRKPEHPVLRQIRADNPDSSVFNARRAEAKAAERAMKAASSPEKAFSGPPRPPRVPEVYKALASDLRAAVAAGERPENPAQRQVEKSRGQALQGWHELASALDAAGDKDLAKQIRELMEKGREISPTRNQELYDAAAAGRSRPSDSQEQER